MSDANKTKKLNKVASAAVISGAGDKGAITPSEAGFQRDLLRELYQKELIAKFANTNGYDKVFLIEQVTNLFAKYKINRENMQKVEKKLAKQFDFNYMKKFQMKQTQMIDDKAQKQDRKQQASKKQSLKTNKPAPSEPEKSEPVSTAANEQSLKPTEKPASEYASLAGSAPCDLKKLWEIENKKLREQKLKEQEERRNDLDRQKNTKHEDMLREKKEDQEYMRDVRKENRRLDRVDREKAKAYQAIIDADQKRLKEQESEKRRIAESEARYDKKKHDEMIEIVEKGNKEENRKNEIRAREMRKLLRYQIREMKTKVKQDNQERNMEKELEGDRNRLYGELEVARINARQKEINTREERIKNVMNAYHERTGKAIEELELIDEKRMFEEMRASNLKADRAEQAKALKDRLARIDLKRNLFQQMNEKQQRDRTERVFDAENTRLQLHLLGEEGIQKTSNNLNNSKRPHTAAMMLEKSATVSHIQHAKAKVPIGKESPEMYEFTKRMTVNELLINKSQLKLIASKSQPAGLIRGQAVATAASAKKLPPRQPVVAKVNNFF